jgi:phosphoglycolate phosphatase
MSPAALVDRYGALVFDLDGTLIDTAGDIRATLSLALADCGLAPLPPHEKLPDVHSPLRGIVTALLESRGQDSAPAGDVVLAYQGRFAQQAHANSVLYPGVLAFLNSRQRRGCLMAVCTNKRRDQALAVLDHFELLGFFSHVVGSDSAAHPKPDSAPLHMALTLLEAVPADALLFGDTHVDALCAQRSGVRFAWHRGGYGGEEVLRHPVACSFGAFADLEPARAPSLREGVAS